MYSKVMKSRNVESGSTECARRYWNSVTIFRVAALWVVENSAVVDTFKTEEKSGNLDYRRSHNSRIGEKLLVVGLLKVHFHVIQGFTLSKVMVVRVSQKTGSHAAHERLYKRVVHVESGHPTRSNNRGNRFSRHG